MFFNVRYLIAGAFSRTIPIFEAISRYKGNARIVVYDGINKCKWNGGRINRDVVYSETTMKYYYSKDVGIALTFTNNNIDLDDVVGNHLLEKFHRAGNAIILVNNDLREYIKKNYPRYELIYSITGMGTLNIPLQDSDIQIYKRLESAYDWIVPRFEHVFDKRADELDRTKWEVMVNDTCVWKCKRFDEHFKAIAMENTLGNAYSEEIEECWIAGFNPDIDSKQKSMDIDIEHIEKLKALGVQSFKIIGRELDDDTYAGELKRYLI
jgi:hypothetical protein